VSGASGPTLAFSTLGCPEWDELEVVRQAAGGGWDGVEWRGGPDGTVRTGWPSGRRRELRRAMDDAGLASIAVTTYSNLISGQPSVIRASIDDAVAHAELATDLRAPAIRVFLGERDDDAPAAALEGRATDGLAVLVDRVRPLGVRVAVEPHDDHVRWPAIRPILEALRGDALGVVWDVGNAWSVGEDPADSLAAYRGRIAWVQVKDGTGTGSTWRLCEPGDGEVPLERALSALAAACSNDGVDVPPISLEWERAWHPDLAPAELVLPRALAWLQRQFARPADTGR
jgi:sugar phosphate isomerase/epimerase